MADKYVSNTGLQYFFNRIKTIFAKQADLDTLDAKVEGIITQGGEPNVIETVKVNGTALTPDANKAVDVEAGVLSQLINSGEFKGIKIQQGADFVGFDASNPNGVGISATDGTTTFNKVLADLDYVTANGGKIDKIKVNGTEQTITNKEVDIPVPKIELDNSSGGQFNNIRLEGLNKANLRMEASDQYSMWFWFHTPSGLVDRSGQLMTKTYVDATFRTAQQVQDAIDASLAGITGIDFQIVDTLPATGEKGIIYLLANSGTSPNIYDEYIWIAGDPTGHFEKIGTTDVDLSQYWSKSELVALTTAEIDTIIDAA